MSHTLFILFAKVVAKALNKLFFNKEFKGFGMPNYSERINYLIYADDTLIFYVTDKKNGDLVVRTLNKYEMQFGQKMKKEKSSVFFFHKTTGSIGQMIEDVTGFSKVKFPIIYLVCSYNDPIY